MLKVNFKSSSFKYLLLLGSILLISCSTSLADDTGKSKVSSPVPVRVAIVEKKMVSSRISLVGTTEAIACSTVAAEVSGVVEYYPVKEGDFVKKGELLVRLRSTDSELRLKGAIAAKEKIRANLQNAEKELARFSKLKDTNSIAARKYDEALYNHNGILQEFLQSKAEVERLCYEIKQKEVFAPFSGFIVKEYAQIGEWINCGGPVVAMLDLGQIRISVDVPERYAVMLSPQSKVSIIVKSISNDPFLGRIYAVLPQGDQNSRTFPVRINLPNPDLKIKDGMEAMVTFNLPEKESALLIPKDAVVVEGNKRLVFSVTEGKAMPVYVKVIGYYNGNTAVKGDLEPGDQVVIRGNERLRPGQSVRIVD